MKKIFRKHVNYDYIKKKTQWLVRGRFSYEGFMHGHKKRMKIWDKQYKRTFEDHWVIKTRIKKEKSAICCTRRGKK